MKLRHRGRTGIATVVGFAIALGASGAEAQLRDITQVFPSVPGGVINKSFAQEIGIGRGNILVPDSSLFIINRDPFRAIRRGRQIFQRKFQFGQGLGPMTDDGVGNVAFIGGDPSHAAGFADSCAGCHGRPRGAAGHGGDVATRPDSRDAPHLFGLGLQEQLADEMTRTLRGIRTGALAQAESDEAPVTRVLRAKGVSFGSITVNPDGTFDTAAVVGVDPDLRIRPFFAHGGTISIREFLVGAFNAEMGLEGADPDLILASSGGTVLTPSGMLLDGRIDRIEAAPVGSPTTDGDFDEIPDEVPVSIVDFMEFYLLNYFKPGLGPQTAAALAGRAVFTQIGCATCHVPTLTITRDRRVADLDTVFDDVQGNPFNRLFSTATPRVLNGLAGIDDFSGFPHLKVAAGQSFVVNNFFADFKRHDLGPNFHERNYEGTFTTLFITEPLWGVSTTAPYGHDGRSGSLEDVILRHGGEAQAQRDAFASLNQAARDMVMAFLDSLVLFAPDDTASTLQPKNPSAVHFPQNGHGAIALTPLFNNPADLE